MKKIKWKIKWNWKYFLWIVGVFSLLLILAMVYQTHKGLPSGTSYEGDIRYIDENSVQFLRDLTYYENESLVRDHEIFDRVFEMIEGAEKFILIDMFLMGNSRDGYRNLSLDLKDALIQKKESNPDIIINFITDEFNIKYFSYYHPDLFELKSKGVNVIFTDMTVMRDSNFIYSSFWRVFFQWFGRPSFNCENSFIKNDGINYCFRSILRMLNSKANHRKVVVADSGEKVVSLITSANPDDYGSGYSNVGLYFEEGIGSDIYFAEKAVGDFSFGDFEEYDFGEVYSSGNKSASVQFLTEGKIKEGLIEIIKESKEGENIDITMFLLTERDVINSLVDAANRGVKIRIIADPSNDLFMKDSKGVPNCPAAKDLLRMSDGKIGVRWYNTGNQQFHSKMLVIRKNSGDVIVFLGSANFTRRNLDDLNIEASVKLVVGNESRVSEEVYVYFRELWEGEGSHTVGYENNKCSAFSYLKYRVQEATGFGAF
jgi:cardiolipin synthase A/B